MNHRAVIAVFGWSGLLTCGGCSGTSSDDGSAVPVVGATSGQNTTPSVGGSPHATGTGGAPVVTSSAGMTTRPTSGGSSSGGNLLGGTSSVASSGGTLATGGTTATGGTSATGGLTATGGASATGGSGAASPSTFPTAKQNCPALTSGMVSFLGNQVSLAVGPAGKKGPVLFYWHATGMTYTEVQTGFGAAIEAVKANGGVVASFTTTTASGTNTGNGVWYTGDIDVADEVLACALQQGLVDVTRIHVSGYSAGGLQCAAMSYLRSGYVASVLCMSGGIVSTVSTYALQDPNYVPGAIAAHGASGSDVFILDFATCSGNYCKSVASKGGLAIDCNDNGDHIMSMTSRASTLGKVAWQFFAENPYGSTNRYSTGLPSYFPSYCAIVK